MGLDTNGHAFKPNSEEFVFWTGHSPFLRDRYLENIELVDRGIQHAVEMIENYYKDGKTAFVFTADHGMSNIGKIIALVSYQYVKEIMGMVIQIVQ